MQGLLWEASSWEFQSLCGSTISACRYHNLALVGGVADFLSTVPMHSSVVNDKLLAYSAATNMLEFGFINIAIQIK